MSCRRNITNNGQHRFPEACPASCRAGFFLAAENCLDKAFPSVRVFSILVGKSEEKTIPA
jgi:hypothetical protein